MIYAGILVDRVRTVTESLIDNEMRKFRSYFHPKAERKNVGCMCVYRFGEGI